MLQELGREIMLLLEEKEGKDVQIAENPDSCDRAARSRSAARRPCGWGQRSCPWRPP